MNNKEPEIKLHIQDDDTAMQGFKHADQFVFDDVRGWTPEQLEQVCIKEIPDMKNHKVRFSVVGVIWVSYNVNDEQAHTDRSHDAKWKAAKQSWTDTIAVWIQDQFAVDGDYVQVEEIIRELFETEVRKYFGS